MVSPWRTSNTAHLRTAPPAGVAIRITAMPGTTGRDGSEKSEIVPLGPVELIVAPGQRKGKIPLTGALAVRRQG
jgi:hypothetical protein